MITSGANIDSTAAKTPSDICQHCHRLLEIIEKQLPIASRFTVSDLGAAAELAMGAIRGAILTTDVNIALLREEPGCDPGEIDALESAAGEIVRASSDIAGRIATQSSDSIYRASKGQSS